MKYIVGAIVAVIAILFIRDMSIKSPCGVYMDDNRAMILNFEKNGRLTINAMSGSTIMINNQEWEGPQTNQIRVTSWKRKGNMIYIYMPGEKSDVPAFKIYRDDLYFGKVCMKHIL